MSSIENWMAVNVALIPDAKGQFYCRGLSQKLNNGQKVFLNGKRLPHLTLWMGAVRTDDLNFLKEWTRTVDLKIILHHPQINRLKSASKNQRLQHLNFEESDLIRTLHKTIHQKTEAFEKCPDADKILYAEEVSASTRFYTIDFHESHSVDNYSPHITLGYGEEELSAPSQEVILEKLGVFLMGDSCTCVKEL